MSGPDRPNVNHRMSSPDHPNQKPQIVSGIGQSDLVPLATLTCYRSDQVQIPGNLVTVKKIDPLIQALLDCESRLRAWINESPLNADLFRRDPLIAIRTANVGVDERLLSEFEDTVTRIARKIKLP
jgi:hypothetical protein